jgi:hypothetical protein
MEKHKREPVPGEFKSLEEAGEFWDTHSAADYWDDMEEVVLEVDIQDRRFVVLLEDAYIMWSRSSPPREASNQTPL